jgi:predicted AAA+ superfamily ATPase
MKICAEQTGSLRDDAKIIAALHCSRVTLSKYRDYLQTTMQYKEIYPVIESSVKRLVKSPKGYLINNGLVSYLTGIHNLSILKNTGLVGHRFENWFLNEIQTWMDTCPERNQISFWRTSTGLEVDFVVSLAGQIVPFEITIASQGVSKKVSTLKKFMAENPKCNLGVICYPGKLCYDEENSILFLPAWIV